MASQEAAIQQDQDPQNALAALITVQYILPVLGLTCAHINLEAFSHTCWLQMGPIAEEQGGPLQVTTSCTTAASASQHGSSTATTTATCAAESGSGRHEAGSSSSSTTEQQQAQAGGDGGSGLAAGHVVLTQTVRVQFPPPEAVLQGYGTGLGEQELREAVEDVATDTVNLQESLTAAVQLEGFDAVAAAAAAVVTVL